MTHEDKISHWLPSGTGLVGVEIGAGASPVPGLDPAPTYVDCFKSFGAEPNRADYFGHAAALPFHDHSLDYVIANASVLDLRRTFASVDSSSWQASPRSNSRSPH